MTVVKLRKDSKKRTWKHIAVHVLRNRADFKEEPSDLQLLLRSRGHILVMSVSHEASFTISISCHWLRSQLPQLRLLCTAEVSPRASGRRGRVRLGVLEADLPA